MTRSTPGDQRVHELPAEHHKGRSRRLYERLTPHWMHRQRRPTNKAEADRIEAAAKERDRKDGRRCTAYLRGLEGYHPLSQAMGVAQPQWALEAAFRVSLGLT